MVAHALISRTIRGLFMETGWNAAPVAGGWRLNHTGPDKQTLYAGLGEHWLSFSQRLDRPDVSNEGGSAWLYHKLLSLNERDMFLTKFALNAAGDLMLSAEVPLVGNYLQVIERTLDAFVNYGTLYQTVVRDGKTVARNKAGASTYTIPAETFMEFVSRLEPYNWGSQKKPSGHSWHLGYKGRLRLYDVYFSVTASWAMFQVPVLLKKEDSERPPDLRAQRLFLRYLLRLNDELYLVKFGMNEQGQTLLLLEVPVHDLNYELFLFAIRTISKYLEAYTQELEIMSAPERDENIFKLLLQADSIGNPGSVWI